ncbi:MAG TPA: Sir2 family NAD-dependent protein deacetylase [Syntrophomonadaceae bacterium]|nr:Sir2 family NAD-dependent protein deacetylase [Syntrophomonadaceae bacterium]
MINNLVEQILMYPRPWILTGAGISTESGIPDFRSSGGLWEKVDPIENFSTWALYNNPKGFFTHGLPLFQQVLAADPNDGHIILGELQEKGFLGPVITQNVDSLHQKGGAAWVYEIHGHLRTASCMDCPQSVTMEELFTIIDQGEIPPRCECGGMLKPDVILFGDSMPNDFQDAIRLIRALNPMDNMIIVIGSSLTVSPINLFPYEFEKLAILNNSSTALDNNAEIIIRGTAGNIMQNIRQGLIELNKGEALKVLPMGFIPGRLVSMVSDIGESVASKKASITTGELDKLGADFFLLETLYKNYPHVDTREPIEKYLLNHSLEKIQALKSKYNLNRDYNNTGYIPKSLNDIIEGYFDALQSYIRQYNCQAEIARGIAQQILGLIGLYRFLGDLGIQTFDYSYIGELPDKIRQIANRLNFKLDMEKAMQDF